MPSVPKRSFAIYGFLAGGAAGGLAAGMVVLGAVVAGAGVVLVLDFGAAVAAGAFLSYISTISLVMSMPLAAHRTGVCCELTSMMMAKPLSVAYFATTCITRWPSSCMIL